VNEKAFYSKNFIVKCPVWILVDLKKYKKDGFGAVLLYAGEPGLGDFLPLFLSLDAANAFIEQLGLEGLAAPESVGSTADLRKIVSLPVVKNVVVYLEKGKVRFYRAEDLREELRGHLRN
jgi:hypothetical protein